MSKVLKLNKGVSLKGRFRPLDAVLRIRDVALTGYLIQSLKEKLDLDQQTVDELYEAAARFQTTPIAEHLFSEAMQKREDSPDE
ncbi:hypothetical protein [Paraburkholderia youngii]|uniref:hypothetical protein n=1 Tax=Paraburkholderia youngii TaxID=2782701 RepID=UPI003D1FDCE1